MRHIRRIVFASLAAALALAATSVATTEVPRARTGRAGVEELPLKDIKLPPGFSITIYATDVPQARQMALGGDGMVYVGSMRRGNVYAVVDRNHDNRADEVVTVASGMRMPSGVAYHDGALYVGDVSRVLKFDRVDATYRSHPTPVVITDKLPPDAHHGWKFIAFGPDGLLYVPIGAPCNICEPSTPYASIARMKPDGSGFEIFARGVRNTVGFDWHPQTKELWFTDNGRDDLGDEVPPDELNTAPRKDMHFGYPYCHGGTIPDPEYGSKRPCSELTPPAMRLGPHVAGIGMRFYTGTMFPADYRNQIFIAEHGSWNRSHKIGYRITLVRLSGGRAEKYEPFAEGWLQGERAWGRPADVLVMPDGALLVSDDQAGAIYRIAYRSR